MARRFGGPNSPGGDPRPNASGMTAGPVPTHRPHPVGARVHLLFVLPFLFAVSAFFKDPAGLAANLSVFALLLLSAWLTREGVIAQDAYDNRRVARRPAIPRKIFAAAGMGLALGVAGLIGAGSPVSAAIFGGLGAVLHLAAFGPDPLKDKGMEGVDLFQTDRVARAVEEAEEHLAAISNAILRVRDRAIDERVREFQAHVRALLRTVENDPRRLSAARRYMGVYLLGARDATLKFADLYARNRDAGARADYVALLDDLQENFALRTETLLDSDRQALDIEIDVLRERLEREGVRAPVAAGTLEDIATAVPSTRNSSEKGS
ncbi:MAG: 5-bromo-4-chloroindolyl phosphate hydrolysis protein [Rhodobacteraceae bacterium HLUCCA12]|nr:MAG: 5-bromo-4-chloroindolyl phosphate hydrolysis protein [Rhodobacteraceae bacterium HLUCCA12]